MAEGLCSVCILSESKKIYFNKKINLDSVSLSSIKFFSGLYHPAEAAMRFSCSNPGLAKRAGH